MRHTKWAWGLSASLLVATARGGVNNDCAGNGAGVFPNPDGVHTFTITGGQVAGAGATLFADFFLSPSSTNDWIDADNDGDAGFFNVFPFVDQLATLFTPAANLTTHWIFQYRSVGSVNGYNEFVENQTCHALRTTIPADACQFNGFVYGSGGTQAWGGPFANPSGTPLEPCEIEFAFLDVPSVWGTQVPGTPEWDRDPASPGYGLNPVPSSTGYISNLQTLSRDCGTCSGDGRPCTSNVNCNGTCNNLGVRWCLTDAECPPGQTCEGDSACVPTATSAVQSLNQTFGSPDADTIYDKFAAWVPVVYVANRGTGLQNITYTDAQYAFLAGRMPNGENLVVGTRSVGSGTRNAIMNSTGMDTSWTRGDNTGNENATTANFNLGPGTQRSNAEGSSQVEQGAQMSRLALAYTGLGGSSRAIGDFNAGRFEILNLCKDIDGGDPDALPDCDCSSPPTNYVRPGINPVLDNCNSCTGYTIGGQGSFVLRGNPDANRHPMDPFYNPTDPPLDNQEVANYINNIFDSIVSFDGSAFAGQCFAGETCEFKKCSGAPDATCTGTGQGTCPSGQTCNFVNCVQDADCAAILPGLGACNVPRNCNNDTPCTTKTCSETGVVCTGQPDPINCPNVAQTCDGGLCSIDNQPCIDNLDCAVIVQTCIPDFCKSKLNMPGQFLANTFFLPNSIDCAQALTDGVAFGPNPVFSQAVQNFVRANNGLGVGGDTGAFGSKNIAGLVPVRNALSGGAKYSDGSTTGSYTYWNGASYVTSFTSNLRLSKRNQLTGDFNEDGQRTVADAAEMVKASYAPRAWQQSARGIGNGVSAFDLGQQTLDNGIPEVMGDFDGDGNFDKEDLRYFADGLALDSFPLAGVGNQLDRKQGAIAVDTAINAEGRPYPWADQRQTLTVPPATQPNAPMFLEPHSVNDCSTPFLATRKPYAVGDFRGDVAGGRPQTCVNNRCSATGYSCSSDLDCPPPPPTAGAPPIGWDGVVAVDDIDYCCAMAQTGDWSNIDQAVFTDLSCDMDGDLDVDQADIAELVQVILGTHFGDVDLDGDRDADDQAIVDASVSGPNPCIASATCGWADGDTNCDGVVDATDQATFAVLEAGTFVAIECPVFPVEGEKIRALSIDFSGPSAVAAGTGFAIRVRPMDLQNPVPPNAPPFPAPNFGAFEVGSCTAVGEANGCARWVGRPLTFLESQDSPGIGNYRAARLQCTPYYHDWTGEAVVHLFAAEIMPSSSYQLDLYPSDCKGLEATCQTAIPSVGTLATRRHGDIAAPFNPPSISTQPDSLDVGAAVAKFKNLPGALPKAAVQGQPNLPELNTDVDALDIISVVDAFKGFAYPYTGPCVCPSTVTCGATPCTSAGQCSGGTCVRTCSSGDHDGEPCVNNTHCPNGTCGSGACRDRCGRCSP